MSNMKNLRNELLELICEYAYDVTYDMGDGIEPYDGCEMNLKLIINDDETTIERKREATAENPHELWEAFCPSMNARLYFDFDREYDF